MRTYIYRVFADSTASTELAQVPTDPAHVKFAFSVLGEATLTDTQPDEGALASGFAISSKNPFIGPGAFHLKLSKAAHVRIEVFDVAGRSVKILQDGKFGAGLNEVRWDATNKQGVALPSGIYFARVRVGEATQVRKVVLLQ